MFILVLFAVFAEHLSVVTLSNYLTSIFADEDSLFLTLILVFGSISYLMSGFFQGILLDKIGKVYLKEIILIDLFLSGGVIVSMAMLPARLGVIWVALKFFSVILTSSYYAHFAVEHRFSDKDSRSMGNSLVFITGGLASMFSVVLPIARSTYDRAFFTISSVNLIVMVLVVIFYDNKDIFDRNNSEKDIKSDGIKDLEKTGGQSVKTVSIWKALGNLRWIQIALFIVLKNAISSIVFTNIMVFIPRKFECDSAQISLIRLTLTIAAMILGTLVVVGVSKIRFKSDLKITLVFLVFAAIGVCSFFFDETLMIAVIVASCFAVIDFSINPMVISMISTFGEAFPTSMQGKILSITLSLAHVGNSMGPFIASLGSVLVRQSISYSIMGVAFISLVLLAILNNRNQSKETNDDFLTHFEPKKV